MTKGEYLLTLKNSNPAEIRDTWASLGSLTCSNKTKVYLKDAIYQINEENAPYNGALIFINYEYKAESIDDCIIWEDMATTESISGYVSFCEGVQAPHFSFLLSKEELDAIEDPLNENIIPFEKYKNNDCIVDIPDEDFLIIMSENGVPFLPIEQLEYNKSQIINIFIKPMLDLYWTYFPYIEEQYIGNFGSNQEFEIEFPKYAYNCIAYYTIGPTSGSSGSSFGTGAFNTLRTEMMFGGSSYGMGASRFGRGLRYNKPVPGYTGGANAITASLMNLCTQQGYTNFFRREKVHKKRKDGKLYMYGFSTIGGALNVKWLMAPPDWNLVEFELLPDLRDICKGNVLQNFAMLRMLAKSDSPSAIDFSNYQSRAEKLISDVKEKWKMQSSNLMHAVLRGGLN